MSCKSSRYSVDFFVLVSVRGFGEPGEYSKRISKIIHAFFMDKNEIHIGNRIKQVLDEQGRSITWLAGKINCSRENMYKIFRRSWIHTDMLQKISAALNHDFFREYSKWLEKQKA